MGDQETIKQLICDLLEIVCLDNKIIDANSALFVKIWLSDQSMELYVSVRMCSKPSEIPQSSQTSGRPMAPRERDT